MIFEVNHSRDFETSCDYRLDAGFVTAKKQTTIIHVGSHFSLGSTAQPK